MSHKNPNNHCVHQYSHVKFVSGRHGGHKKQTIAQQRMLPRKHGASQKMVHNDVVQMAEVKGRTQQETLHSKEPCIARNFVRMHDLLEGQKGARDCKKFVVSGRVHSHAHTRQSPLARSSPGAAREVLRCRMPHARAACRHVSLWRSPASPHRNTSLTQQCAPGISTTHTRRCAQVRERNLRC